VTYCPLNRLLKEKRVSVTRDLKIVSAAMLTWGIGEGMFLIFQPLYIQQFGADPIMIGAILGINGLVMTLVQIPSGYLADKLGRRPLMRFSWISGVVATWCMAFAPSLIFYVLGFLLYGITSSVMAPLNTYIQGARGKWSVGKAVSYVSAFYNVGGILGPILGGLIGEVYNLRSVYYAAGAIFTISTVIVLFAGKQTVQDQTPMEGEVHLLRNNQFIIRLVIVFLVMLAVVLPQPLAANFLQNERGLSFSQIGQLGSLGALGSVVLMVVFGHLQTGYALMIGQLGVVLFSLLLWRGQNIFWYGIGFVFLGGFRLCRAMTVALVRPVVREREVGLAFGMVESLNSLAFMIAPVIAGFLFNWQPISIFTIAVGLLLLTLMVNFIFMRREMRQPDYGHEDR